MNATASKLMKNLKGPLQLQTVYPAGLPDLWACGAADIAQLF